MFESQTKENVMLHNSLSSEISQLLISVNICMTTERRLYNNV